MAAVSDQLPITEITEPDHQTGMVDVVADAYGTATPIYPLGGQTALDFGVPATRSGIGLSTTGLKRVIDYPARDMTITVEAGVTMEDLSKTLADENQELPVDVPQSGRATLGGVIATNFNGPRRYGRGNLRDYVIGISAVDGRGKLFKGGGRVVKNVAGYDFCKLLTGSLGTLGVVTQVTLKLKPIAQRFSLIACTIPDLESASRLLDRLASSEATPTAIEMLSGPIWDEEPALEPLRTSVGNSVAYLLVSMEGTEEEVEWTQRCLTEECRADQLPVLREIDEQQSGGLWNRLVEFPASDSALRIKASVVPSGTVEIVRAVQAIDSQCSIQAHAGSGVVIACFPEVPQDGLSRTLIGQLQPLANALHGGVVVMSNPTGGETTHRSIWGGLGAPLQLMARVKREFDPRDILNPGRFVYS